MKIQVEVDEIIYDVEIDVQGAETTARVGDREYLIEASEPEPNIYLLKNNGTITEAFVENGDSPLSHRVTIGTHQFEATVIDPKRLRGVKGNDEHAAGRAELKTAMPGKIVRILVSEGDTVQKGDGVIVVEAMKMQNEMKAPKDGVVSEIKVAESDTVSAGDILVVIE